MIISNIIKFPLFVVQYQVTDATGTYNDGGSLISGNYVEFCPRGNGPYTVELSGTGRQSPQIQLTGVRSPDAIVTVYGFGQGDAGISG